MNISIKLPARLKKEYQKEVIKNIYWIDRAIESAKYQEGSEDVLEIQYAGTGLSDEIKEQIKTTAVQIIDSIERVEATLILDRMNIPVSYKADPHSELQSKGWIQPMSQGSYAFSGLFLKLRTKLDQYFLNYACTIGCREYQFPSTLQLHDALKCGYIENHPQNINVISHAKGEQKFIRGLKDSLCEAKTEAVADVWRDHVDAPDSIQAPCICYHYWSHFPKDGQAQKAPLLSTASGVCHRYEGQATFGLERLREFTMREIFAIGKGEDIQRLIEEFMEYLKDFLINFGLAGQIQAASDPFFLDTYSTKRMYQVGMSLKFEAGALLPYNQSILAIGSVNQHQDYFVRSFGLDVNKGLQQSCCLAFGLERICLAIFAQHGFDIQKWPEQLRNLIKSSNNN